jgi:hypothetical protein
VGSIAAHGRGYAESMIVPYQDLVVAVRP